MDTKTYSLHFPGGLKANGGSALNGNGYNACTAVATAEEDSTDDYYYSIMSQKLNELTLENETSGDGVGGNGHNGSDVNGNSPLQTQHHTGDDLFGNSATSLHLPRQQQHFLPSSVSWTVDHLQGQLRHKLAGIKQCQARCQAGFQESQQQLIVAVQLIQRLVGQVEQELTDQLEMATNHQMLEFAKHQAQVEEAIAGLDAGSGSGEQVSGDSEMMNFVRTVLETPMPGVLDPPRLPPLDPLVVERTLRSFFTRQPFVPAFLQQQMSPSTSDSEVFSGPNIGPYLDRSPLNNWSDGGKTAIGVQPPQHFSNGNNFIGSFEESDLNLANFLGSVNGTVGQFNGNNNGHVSNSKSSTTAAGLPVGKSLPVKIRRDRMTYYCKFGEQGMADGQFAEPSGVAVNEVTGDIVIADANNHRVQVFDRLGKFKFHFGDGKLKFPNRVAISKNTGEYVVSERPPVHQIQVYNKNGVFVCKFGAKHLKHPRGLCVDHRNRVVVVECKVMRVFIFNLRGDLLHSFDCSKQIQFPNAVTVSRRDEIYISDNRSHCVKVFNFQGDMLRQIGGSGITNYPIGVCLNEAQGLLWVIDNYNNLNVTIFRIDGQLVAAYESSLKHQQCLDVAMHSDSSIVVTSKDLQVYIYRIKEGLSPAASSFSAGLVKSNIGYNGHPASVGHKMATAATARHHSGGTTNL